VTLAELVEAFSEISTVSEHHQEATRVIYTGDIAIPQPEEEVARLPSSRPHLEAGYRPKAEQDPTLSLFDALQSAKERRAKLIPAKMNSQSTLTVRNNGKNTSDTKTNQQAIRIFLFLCGLTLLAIGAYYLIQNLSQTPQLFSKTTPTSASSGTPPPTPKTSTTSATSTTPTVESLRKQFNFNQPDSAAPHSENTNTNKNTTTSPISTFGRIFNRTTGAPGILPGTQPPSRDTSRDHSAPQYDPPPEPDPNSNENRIEHTADETNFDNTPPSDGAAPSNHQNEGLAPE
jgi:hypothetical protein